MADSVTAHSLRQSIKQDRVQEYPVANMQHINDLSYEDITRLMNEAINSPSGAYVGRLGPKHKLLRMMDNKEMHGSAKKCWTCTDFRPGSTRKADNGNVCAIQFDYDSHQQRPSRKTYKKMIKWVMKYCPEQGKKKRLSESNDDAMDLADGYQRFLNTFKNIRKQKRPKRHGRVAFSFDCFETNALTKYSRNHGFTKWLAMHYTDDSNTQQAENHEDPYWGGVLTGMFIVGQKGYCQGWHIEPLGMAAANLMFEGRKIWFSFRDDIVDYKTMHKLHSEIAGVTCTNVVFSKSWCLDINHIIAKYPTVAISVHEQMPGDLVVTAPGTAHMVIYLGFSSCYAISLAPLSSGTLDNAIGRIRAARLHDIDKDEGKCECVEAKEQWESDTIAAEIMEDPKWQDKFDHEWQRQRGKEIGVGRIGCEDPVSDPSIAASDIDDQENVNTSNNENKHVSDIDMETIGSNIDIGDERKVPPMETHYGAEPKKRTRTRNLYNGKVEKASNGLFICPRVGCGKQIHSKNMRDHLRTHETIKDYVCSVCKRGFSKKYHLQMHENTHTGERPYRCNECGAAYKSASGLHYHKKTHKH